MVRAIITRGSTSNELALDILETMGFIVIRPEPKPFGEDDNDPVELSMPTGFAERLFKFGYEPNDGWSMWYSQLEMAANDEW